MDVKDKYERMNKLLKLIEETPMIMFSKHDDGDRNGGYFFEQNKIVIPNPQMI